MVKVLLLIIFTSTNALALQGQVISLDVPLFKTESTKSRIVQYVKKGEMIYLHSAVGKQRKFTKHAPKGMTEEDVIEDSIDSYNSDYPDPIFGGDVYYFNPKSQFYQTMDSRGRSCFVLRRHIRIIYKDKRELGYVPPEYDDTDYRLKEPLPKKYPLLANLGYRGMFLAGIGQHNHSKIPYSETATRTTGGLKYDFDVFWLKHIEFDKLERLYFGVITNMTYSREETSNSTTNTSELLFRISAGPTIYYDAWKYQKRRLSTYIGVLFNIYQHKFIAAEVSGLKNKAEYSTFSLSPITGLHYSVDDFYDPDYDLILGVAARYNLPSTYNISGPNSLGLSSYETTANVEVSFNIGLKSDF